MRVQASWGVRFSKPEEVEHFVRQLCGEVEARLSRANLKGRQITVQLWRAVRGAPAALAKGSMGHGLCDRLSRSCSLPGPTADAAVLAREALQAAAWLRVWGQL